MKIPQLETARLRMRAFRNDHLDAYASMCADPEVMKYIGPGATQTRGEAWRAIASMLGHWELRGFRHVGRREEGHGELVGRAGFIEPEGWPGFELGGSSAGNTGVTDMRARPRARRSIGVGRRLAAIA